MDNAERDLEIVKMYAGSATQPSMPASKLSTKFGLSIPTVRRILAEHKAVKDKDAPKPTPDDKVIDPLHRKLGNKLYHYRFKLLRDPAQAADALGWSVKKLRGIEQGTSEITLCDLQDMAEYMQTSISEMTGNL